MVYEAHVAGCPKSLEPIAQLYIDTRINGPRIRAAIDSSLDLDPPRLVEKHLSRSWLRHKISLPMVPSGVQSTVSRHSGATRKVFEPGRQGEEPQNYPLTPLPPCRGPLPAELTLWVRK